MYKNGYKGTMMCTAAVKIRRESYYYCRFERKRSGSYVIGNKE